jgi:predicted DNA-binding transcriptional regulator YafY
VRRADRLFQIIQILRRSRRPVTADAIAAELETSKRTVYRDIADLVGQRAPIRGEAVLGAQLVAQRGGDPALARAAEDLVAKIVAVIPDTLRPLALEPATRAPRNWKAPPVDNMDLAAVRQAVRHGRKIVLHYKDEQERQTRRTVWPFAIGYHEAARMIVAWCELRGGFRSFRTDRVEAAEFLDERYSERPAALRARWRRMNEAMWREMRRAS